MEGKGGGSEVWSKQRRERGRVMEEHTDQKSNLTQTNYCR